MKKPTFVQRTLIRATHGPTNRRPMEKLTQAQRSQWQTYNKGLYVTGVYAADEAGWWLLGFTFVEDDVSNAVPKKRVRAGDTTRYFGANTYQGNGLERSSSVASKIVLLHSEQCFAFTRFARFSPANQKLLSEATETEMHVACATPLTKQLRTTCSCRCL